jgi:NRPS condensation-like uncharacterized protein
MPVESPEHHTSEPERTRATAMSAINDYSKRIAALSPKKRALLELQLRMRGREFNSFPLSFAQQRLWFIDQLEPGNIAYNMPTTVRYGAALDVPALERAVGEIIRRHETLRTIFASVDGQPVQVINPPAPVTLHVTDLQHLPDDERAGSAARLEAEEGARPFDLQRGPLFRVRVARLAEEEYIVVLTLHHIISDGWSTGILLKELSTLYGAFSQGQPSPLAELPIQYADYAQWQRGWLQGEVLETQLAYWKKQLQATEPLIKLPTDKPRPPVLSYRGSKLRFTLTPELSNAIKSLGQREGTTLFMTMFAAFKALLYRYTGQADIVVGSPVAGRNQLETEELIGFFVNMLALRTKIEDNPRFSELLRQVRETTLDAYAHQEVPFDKLVDALQIERNPSYQPLFQVVFALQSASLNPSGVPDVTPTPRLVGPVPSAFDLILEVVDSEEHLGVGLLYNVDIFNETTAARLLEHYRDLLNEVTGDSEKRIMDIRLGADGDVKSAAEESALQTHLEAEEFDF